MKEIKGNCNKVELARIHEIESHCTLHLIFFFYLYLYPDCFIYHFETYQDLSIGAIKVEYFTIKGSLFLAFTDLRTSILSSTSLATRQENSSCTRPWIQRMRCTWSMSQFLTNTTLLLLKDLCLTHQLFIVGMDNCLHHSKTLQRM